MSVPDKTGVRFVCFQSIGRQRSRRGLFKAIDEAVESKHAPGGAIAEARSLTAGFNANLASLRSAIPADQAAMRKSSAGAKAGRASSHRASSSA